MFDFLHAYFTRKNWEQLAPRLSDNTISLFKRAVLATKLINQYNKPDTNLVLCQNWFIKPPVHSLSAFLSELEQAVTTLSETSYLPNFKDRGSSESIRLDRWLFSINETNATTTDLYEGYRYASTLIIQLDDVIKQRDLNLSYIERKCQKHFLTFILITEILHEINIHQRKG